jgi:hypothetical protein
MPAGFEWLQGAVPPPPAEDEYIRASIARGIDEAVTVPAADDDTDGLPW